MLHIDFSYVKCLFGFLFFSRVLAKPQWLLVVFHASTRRLSFKALPLFVLTTLPS